jgi:hypothetical protein
MPPKVGQYARVAGVHVPVCATASAAIDETSATTRIIRIFITSNLHDYFTRSAAAIETGFHKPAPRPSIANRALIAP